MHNLELPKVTKQFLPMGTLVRVRLRNELNQPVTVSKIQTIGLEWIPITSTKLQAGWGLKFDAERQKRSQLNETTPREYVIEGGPISLSPGQTYSKVLLFWSNPLTGGGDDAQINIMPNEAVATPYYTSTGTYYNTDYVLQEEGGKVYGTQSALRIRDGLLRRVTLKLCPFPDPLSLLSEYALNSNGSDFLHDANDPAVGYFNGRDLISTLPTGRAPKTYPSGNGAKWHVPTWNEMSAIFPFEAYLDPRGGAGLSGPYNHTQRVRVGNYYAVVANSYAPYDGGKEIYSLTFGSLKETAYVRTKPDGSIESNLVGGAAMELRDDKRYAYYAKYDDAKQVYVVKSKYVGVDPTIKDAVDVKAKIDWTAPGLTTRTIPMYGWKESATSSPKVGQHTVKFLVNDTGVNKSVEPEDIDGPTPMVKYEIKDFTIVPMGKYTGRTLTGPLGFGDVPVSSTSRYPVFLVKSF